MRITGCHGGEKVGGRPENLAGFRLQTTAGRSWGNTAALVTCPAVGLAEFREVAVSNLIVLEVNTSCI